MASPPSPISRWLCFAALGLIACPASQVRAGVIEVGRTDVGPSGAATVDFRESFDRPPLVFTMPTTDGQRPRSARVSDVGRDGFRLSQAEPAGSNGTAATMQGVPFVAIEPGKHAFNTPGGDTVELEAFSLRTSQTVQRSPPFADDGGHIPVALRRDFDNPAAVLTTIQTVNNEPGNTPGAPSSPWLTTSVKNIQTGGGSDQFAFALERSEVADGATVDADERVAYIAIDITDGALTGAEGGPVAFEARESGNTITDDATAISFNQDAFPDDPIALADKTTRDGRDGGWLQRAGVSASDITLLMREDEFTDDDQADGSHTTEVAAILAFARAFRAGILTRPRDIVWQGVSPDWEDGANWPNWDGDPFNLMTGDTLIFSDTGQATTQTTVDAAHEARLAELRFTGDTAYQLDAGTNGRLHFQSEALIDNRTGDTQTIDVPITAHGNGLTLDTGETTGGELIFDAQDAIDLVDDGTLTIVGDNTVALNAPVTGGIVNHARLRGIGTLGDGDDTVVHQSGATFAPGGSIGVTTVDGDLVQAAGSTLELEIDAGVSPIAPGASHDQVDVSGSAVFQPGSAITLDVTDPEQLEAGDRFNVVTAEAGVTNGADPIDFIYKGLAIRVARDFTDGDTVLPLMATFDLFSPRAVGENNRAVAKGLASLAATRPGGAAESELLAPLRDMVSDVTFNRALRELNATPYAALTDIDRQRARDHMASIGRHLLRQRDRALPRSSRAPSSSASAPQALPMLASRSPSPDALERVLSTSTQARKQKRGHGSAPATRSEDSMTDRIHQRKKQFRVFGGAFGTTANQPTRDRRVGYVARARGGLLGFDHRFTPALTGGLSLRVARTETNFAEGRGTADTDSTRLGAHLSYSPRDWFVDGGVSVGYHDADVTRRVPTLGGEVTGDRESHDLASFARLGLDIELGEWRLSPMVGAQHVFHDGGGVTETGGPAALELDDKATHAFSTRVMGRLSRRLTLAGVVLWPEVSVGWRHDFHAEDDTLEPRFAAGGDSFTIKADASSNDTLLIGGGLSILVHDDLSAYAHYTGELTTEGESHGLSAGLSLRF